MSWVSDLGWTVPCFFLHLSHFHCRKPDLSVMSVPGSKNPFSWSSLHKPHCSRCYLLPVKPSEHNRNWNAKKNNNDLVKGTWFLRHDSELCLLLNSVNLICFVGPFLEMAVIHTHLWCLMSESMWLLMHFINFSSAKQSQMWWVAAYGDRKS